MIRVAVTSDVRIFREGIVLILNQHDDIEAVGVAVKSVLDCRGRHDVHIVDCASAPCALALSAVTETAPRTIALGLPAAERDFVERTPARVVAYVTREDPSDRLLAAVRHAMLAVEGGLDTEAPEARLTPRELQIVQLIDDGLSNRQISDHLQIELSTVKNHVHRIIAKLGVERRSQAAAHFRRRRVDVDTMVQVEP